jgi:hypothetical protein
MLPITYRNFDHFSHTPFAAIPGGTGKPGTTMTPRFYFNPVAIHDAPRQRYEKRLHSTRHMLQHFSSPFSDTGLFLNYYVDGVTGQYFVLRDGALFELKPFDEKCLPWLSYVGRLIPRILWFHWPLLLPMSLLRAQEADVFRPPDLHLEDVPVLNVDAIRSICVLSFLDSDFSSLSSAEFSMVVAVAAYAITLEEQTLGLFTRRKL